MIVAARELKLGFRNPWVYTFLVLFSVFVLTILLIQSHTALEGYTYTTGSLLNLLLYLLPLMTLVTGSFAITAEREEGGWQLLSTYSLSGLALIVGKYAGLVAVMFSIVGFSFGLAGLAGGLVGRGFSLYTLAMFYVASLLIVFVFLAISTLIGSLARNRWQALTFGVGIWFVAVLAWPTLLISVLGFLPYPMIKPALQVLVFLNPAELVRIFMIVKIGGGASFGPEYAAWIQWLNQSAGWWVFLGACLLWILACLGLSSWVWERRRYHV